MMIRNFLFHRVSEEIDAMWPPMKPKSFERIIRYLTRHFNVVPLESFLESPVSLEKRLKPATILFDDGYKDNIEYAAPILKKYNCPASFYIVTDSIDRNIPTWTYLVDHVLAHTKKKILELDYDFVPADFKKVLLDNRDQTNNRKKIKPWMKQLGNTQRLKITEALLEQCNDVPSPQEKMMTWNDIRQLRQDGFIIGSHTHTHPMLASLQKEEEIEQELKISFSRITDELQTRPLTISYPIGSFDERVKRISATCGYQYGLAVEQKFYIKIDADRFEIPRVELYEESWLKTRVRISGMYSYIKQKWV